ncbi:MAG TPA: hypothetical protein VMU02_05070, partial [bacterium]|nr:hypothetical protein [bacterium]
MAPGGRARFRLHYPTCAFVVAAVCATWLFCGCSSDRECNPAHNTCSEGRATVSECLRVLAHAYEDKDINAYAALLDAGYAFQFAPVDWDSAGVTADNP